MGGSAKDNFLPLATLFPKEHSASASRCLQGRVSVCHVEQKQYRERDEEEESHGEQRMRDGLMPAAPR